VPIRHLVVTLAAGLAAFASVMCAPHADAQASAPPAAAKLDTIAVSEVRIDPAIQKTSYFNASIISRAVESALDATRKFRVVSRSRGEAEAFADEAALTRRGGRLVEGATYVLAIEVLGADLKVETGPVPNLPRKESTQIGGRVEMNVTVLTAANRAVKSRFPIEGRFIGRRFTHDYDKPPSPAEVNLGFVDLAQEVGRRVADRVLDEVFPVQVIQRQGNMVFLNRGEDSGFKIGETLRIFSASGERLRDPYTGEDLGPMETQIGTIRVSDLRPKMTIAEVVSETGAIASGALVRRQIERDRN
jgi:hypothetical protein